MHDFEPEREFGPWNPGIESSLPREFLPLATVFRQENAIAELASIEELSDFSGLPLESLAEFRPERLAVHELLIRVTADFYVPDGTKYEDLGTNFRRIAGTILSKYIEPHMDAVRQIHSDLRRQVSELLAQELEVCFRQAAPQPAPAREKRGTFARFGFAGKPQAAPAPLEAAEERDMRIAANWSEKTRTAATELESRVYRALVQVASAVTRRHGRLIGGPELLSSIAIPLVCNEYGSELIGAHIEQHIHRAVSEEGYPLVPAQAQPVVMKVKGASASGKSTMRPMQKQLAARLWNSMGRDCARMPGRMAQVFPRLREPRACAEICWNADGPRACHRRQKARPPLGE